MTTASADTVILYAAVPHDGMKIHWVTDRRADKALCGATAPYAPVTRARVRATCLRCIAKEAGLVARGALLEDEIG